MDEGNHLDDLLRAAFEDEATEGESVLDSIERMSGTRARVLLRDAPEHETPVLHMPTDADAERPKGDRRYQVLGEIARGGIGVIVKGRDRNLGRSVALKVLRREYADNDEVLRRFIEEAQIGGQLQHPGIVPVYGLGISGEDRPYFAMKFVKGETLSALLEDRKDVATDRRKCLGIFEQIAQTVAYAHARGVVHRDLKPSNVMVGTFGEVLVVDWGLAKVLGRPEPRTPQATIISTVRTEGEGSASLVGSVMGTPAYMPPEQALGQVEDLDERSDVFSLGAILTEILTGAPPYEGDTKDQIVQAAQARLDDAMGRLDKSGADPEVVALTKRCLEAVPKDRPRDAGVVAREIAEHLAEAEARALRAEVEAAEERAKAEEEREKEAKERHRVKQERAARRRTLAIAAAVLLLVAAGGTGYLLKDRSDRQRAEAARTAVAQALREATGHLGAQNWDGALAAARKAVALAETRGADHSTSETADALLERVTEERRAESETQRVRAEDRALVGRLKECWFRQDPSDLDLADEEFAAAFRELGVDLESVSPEDAAAWIRSRSMTIEITSLVDYWSIIRRHWLKRSSEDWEWLLEVARRADPDPWRNRLRDATLSGDLDELRRLSEDAEAVALPPLTLDLLAVLLGEQDPEAAVVLLRGAQAHHPDDFLINIHLGQYLGRCDPPAHHEGLRFLTAALALVPDSASVWDAVATDYSYVGDEATALVYECRAVALAPDWAQARNNLGVALASLDRRIEAIPQFRKALDLARSPRLRFVASTNLAQSLRREGEYADAIEAASMACSLAPDDVDAMNMLAWLNVACPDEGPRDLDLAIRIARMGIEIQPGNPSLIGTLGAAYCRKGEHERAAVLLERAISLQRDDEARETAFGDRLFLAMSLWHVGRSEKARALLRSAKDRLERESDADEEDLRILAEVQALIQEEGR